jgi:hypothetical protein
VTARTLLFGALLLVFAPLLAFGVGIGLHAATAKHSPQILGCVRHQLLPDNGCVFEP